MAQLRIKMVVDIFNRTVATTLSLPALGSLVPWILEGGLSLLRKQKYSIFKAVLDLNYPKTSAGLDMLQRQLLLEYP